MKVIPGFSAYRLTETDIVIVADGEFEVPVKDNKVTLTNDKGVEKTVSIGFLKEMAEPMEDEVTPEPEEENKGGDGSKPEEKKENTKTESKKSTPKSKSKKKAAAKSNNTPLKAVPKETKKKPVAKKESTPKVKTEPKKVDKIDKGVSLARQIRDLYAKGNTNKQITETLACKSKYVSDTTWRYDNPGGKKK